MSGTEVAALIVGAMALSALSSWAIVAFAQHRGRRTPRAHPRS